MIAATRSRKKARNAGLICHIFVAWSFGTRDRLNRELNHNGNSMNRFPLILLFSSLFFNHSIAEDWPHWLGPNRDGVWNEENIVEKFPDSGPDIVWRAKIKPGFSGPSVAAGKVFVTDLDSKLVEVEVAGEKKRVNKGKESIRCIDVRTGEEIWQTQYEANYKISYGSGPRVAPTYDDGKIYSVGAMGDVLCLDAAKGEKIWHKNLTKDYKAKVPFWGFSSHPRIDGDRIYMTAGGKGSAVICLDKNSGKEIWKAGTVKDVAYATPVIHEKEGQRELICWFASSIKSFDLDSGKEFWSVDFPTEPVDLPGPSVTIMTPHVFDGKLLVSDYYNGAMLLEMKADHQKPETLWASDPKDRERKEDMNTIMTIPVVKDGFGYTVRGNGMLACYDLKDGSKKWEDAKLTNSPRVPDFASAFIVKNQSRYIIFNDQGELVFANFKKSGYEEIDRAKVIDPTSKGRGRDVVWSHPAFSNGMCFVRNDQELICIDLRKK